MKKTALRFGLYGVFTILVLFIIEWILFRNEFANYNTREVTGWVIIVLSVIFVFFGLKYYRDKENNGVLTFAEGLKLGLLIIIFPSLAFGLFNVFYIEVLDPQFLDKYYNYQVEQVRNTTPPAELTQKLQEMQEQKEMFANIFAQFIFMFLSVFVIGLIVTIISTLILKRKAAEPALA